MAIRVHRRGAAVTGLGVGLALVLAACGADEVDSGAGDDASTAETDCAQYEEFGDIEGESVEIYTSIVAPEDQPYIDAFVAFEDCTGATVNYNGSKEFEAQLPVRVQAGNAPDLAIFPQPGLLQRIVGDNPGAMVAAPSQVEDVVDEYYSADWKAYGTVDGTFYAAPNSANAKSFVWYSPAAFEEAGYAVPETWDELMTLTQQIADDNAGDEAVKPWCAGIESGDATGWVITDWVEDVLLRTAGPDVYDQWVNHEIPFNDPQVVKAVDMAGEILKNSDYVNGGIGDVASIASTAFQQGGLPILDGNCFMHRQASFYAANWPEGTTVAEDGDVYAFYLPAVDDQFGQPVLGGGEFIGAFNDRPVTQAFQTFLVSEDFLNTRAAAGQFIPPSTRVDSSVFENPIDQLSYELLTAEDSTFRFDGSDLMPAEIGANEFWTQGTAWIAENRSTEEMLTNIENAWPAS